jgi:hypothetical protein
VIRILDTPNTRFGTSSNGLFGIGPAGIHQLITVEDAVVFLTAQAVIKEKAAALDKLRQKLVFAINDRKTKRLKCAVAPKDAFLQVLCDHVMFHGGNVSIWTRFALEKVSVLLNLLWNTSNKKIVAVVDRGAKNISHCELAVGNDRCVGAWVVPASDVEVLKVSVDKGVDLVGAIAVGDRRCIGHTKYNGVGVTRGCGTKTMTAIVSTKTLGSWKE